MTMLARVWESLVQGPLADACVPGTTSAALGDLGRRPLTSFVHVELPGTQVVSCQSTGADLRWSGPVARVVCPSRCESEPSAVPIGSGVHPMRSPVCASAIVDKVMPYFGGEIFVKETQGLPAYSPGDGGVNKSLAAVGEPGNGYHVYALDTIDLPKEIPWEMPANCAVTFKDLFIKRTGLSVPVRCHRGCAGEALLEGTGLFTPGSSVCRAAHHDGIIGSKGGHIMVTRQHGQNNYFGSRGHKDQSKDAPQTDDSYTVSFPTPDILSRSANEAKWDQFL